MGESTGNHMLSVTRHDVIVPLLELTCKHNYSSAIQSPSFVYMYYAIISLACFDH
jgi:hypothetical protein